MAPGGEHLVQELGNLPWLLVNLCFAETDHLEALTAQLEIPGMIVLERLATSVVAIAVGFDDQAPLAP